MFSVIVKYLECEYNYAEEMKREQEKTQAHVNIPRFIHLLNLDDIKKQIGENAYNALRKAISGNIVENVQGRLMLQSEWKSLTTEVSEDGSATVDWIRCS